MKRYLLCMTVVVILCFATESWALFKLGLKGGVNLANVRVSQSNVDYGIKPGVIVGAFGEIPLTPSGQLGVRGELLYAQKGTQYELFGSEIKWYMDEVVLAPFLLFRFPVPRLNPFLQAGPELGFNTRSDVKTDGHKHNYGHLWKDNSLSLNLGAGISVPVGLNDLTIDVRYNLGLSDVNDGMGTSGTEIKTNGIQLLVGLALIRI